MPTPHDARRWLRALGACAGALALAAMSDAEPEPLPCRTSHISVRIDEGARLVDAPGGRLELSRGRALACERPEAQAVLAALELALAGFPRARLAEPLQVHLDPRLPARQAPLSGIEVHVTSRELLVARATIDRLPAKAWRHELFHALAARVPALPPEARHLWLTLEEAVVQYLTRAAPRPGATLTDEVSLEAPRTLSAAADDVTTPPAVLPLGEWLASPAYDPHPLAAELARALRSVAPRADDAAWIDCLAAAPALATAGSGVGAPPGPRGAVMPEAWPAVWNGFMGRCSSSAGAHLAAALGRWWGPPSVAEPSEPGKATARWLESR